MLIIFPLHLLINHFLVFIPNNIIKIMRYLYIERETHVVTYRHR
jgi:hypothetical protein